MPKKMFINILLLVLFILYPKEAYAYVDPGTGGYIFQVLFLFFSAIIGFLAFFRNKVAAVISSVLRPIKNLLIKIGVLK